jgi:DNA-binding transcriptional LysR family regulator
LASPAAEHAVPYLALLDRLWADAGIAARVYEVQDVTVGRAMIAAGLSVGLLSELTILGERPDVAVREVSGDNPHRGLYATWLRGRRVPAVARMVRYLAEAAQARLSAA